jgi:hypothetical protein
MRFSDNKLYACGPEGGDVAGDVRWDAAAKVITWFNPGGRQRAYDVRDVVADTADRFVFHDSQGRRFELRELTPAFYNDKIRRTDQPRLETEAALLEAFQLSQA